MTVWVNRDVSSARRTLPLLLQMATSFAQAQSVVVIADWEAKHGLKKAVNGELWNIEFETVENVKDPVKAARK